MLWKARGGHTLCKRTSVWVKVFIWPTGFVIQRMTKSVVQTCNRYVTTQIGCSLVWFGLIVGSWYEQFQGPAVPSTLYGQLWQMSPPSMVIGQLAITCIYYEFVGLARCMKHLNNSQHIPYLQGSRLQRRCAGVPRCQRRVPQGELQWGKCSGQQVS